MPTVSVIVPNYNHAPYLKQRIESILRQTFQDFELVLLDDCSTDGSREIIESYRGNPHMSHIVYGEANSGSAFRQWKKGIELAQGEWVWVAESDDWADASFLEGMVLAATTHPESVLISSTPKYVFPDGSTWCRQTDGETCEISGQSFVSQHLLTGNSLTNVSALLMRRESLMQVDFRPAESMKLCGDWYLYTQLCMYGSVVEIHKPLSHFRQHSDSTSATAERSGLALIEGADILSFLTTNFHLSPAQYARPWGRTWAKQEKKYHYNRLTRKQISRKMRRFHSIRMWHVIYRLKYLL